MAQAIDRVLDKGCWTPVETVAGPMMSRVLVGLGALSAAADALHISAPDGSEAELRWELIGSHNAANATAVIAAAQHAGVSLDISVKALASLQRR